MTIDELMALRQAVIEARQAEAALVEDYATFQAECEALRAAINARAEPFLQVERTRHEAEEVLRLAMIAAYRQDASTKQLLPGLSIRIQKRLSITNPDAARQWAIRNGAHLKVDEKGLLAEAKQRKNVDGGATWVNSGMAAFTAEDEVVTPVIAKELV